MDIAIKVLAPFFGAPQAIVIGRGEWPDALNAAFLNAVRVHDRSEMRIVVFERVGTEHGGWNNAEQPRGLW